MQIARFQQGTLEWCDISYTLKCDEEWSGPTSTLQEILYICQAEDMARRERHELTLEEMVRIFSLDPNNDYGMWKDSPQSLQVII